MVGEWTYGEPGVGDVMYDEDEAADADKVDHPGEVEEADGGQVVHRHLQEVLQS